MRIKLLLSVLSLLTIVNVFAQENKLPDVKFYGYVNLSAIYDSRQVIAAREGHFFLYPKNILRDAAGNDLNAVSNFNMAAIMSRLGVKISGLELLDAKVGGVLETEFMGNSEADVNGLRIRHAYFFMNWKNVELTLGQTWNPFLTPEVLTQQVGSNGSAPFQPFGRNPQIRLSYLFGNFRLSGIVATQRDYSSNGPLGTTNEYLRNAVLPDFYLTFQARYDQFIAGFGLETKSLRPQIKTSKNYLTEETVSSSAVTGYAKIKLDLFSLSIQGVYGGNLTDMTMLGGYAVSNIDTVKMVKEFTPTNTYSVYSDLSFGKDIEFGVFAGYTKNLGADKNIYNEFYARGNDVDNIIRVAPRIQFLVDKMKFGFELEYTKADFGINDQKGKVIKQNSVENYRIHSSMYYFF